MRASRKLKNDELLITTFAASRLRMEMDRVPLWRGDHVAVRQLIEDFARYLYLPRLKHPSVLVGAIRDGFGLLTWEQDSFAYAESRDDVAERYRGIRGGQTVNVDESDSGLLVRSDVARGQIDAERPSAPVPGSVTGSPATSATGDSQAPTQPTGPVPPLRPNRYHGTVSLDPMRVGRDASKVADEVITHLAGLVSAQVTVTLEIHAEIPGGAPEQVVRTVTENARTLKFTSQGFEVD